MVLHDLAVVAAGAFQVYGVMEWHWDTFQILVLYWMETVVIGLWAMLRLAVLPDDLLGDITINGRVVPATSGSLLLVFAPFIAIGLPGHLLILWVIFSGAWSETVHGPSSFLSAFLFKSGAWASLVLTFAHCAAVFYGSPKRHPIFGRCGTPSAPRRSTATGPAVQQDGVTAAIGGALARIVVMQVAIIFGGMLARAYGSTAPWLILIGLKTLVDVRQPRSTTGS